MATTTAAVKPYFPHRSPELPPDAHNREQRSECRLRIGPSGGADMTTEARETREIQWKRDVDVALAEAAHTQQPLLLDFTAAPN
jgi:hypothetical protein